MEREEGADTPDSSYKPGPSLDGTIVASRGPQENGPLREHKVKPFHSPTSRPPASVNGHAGSKDSL